MSLIFSGFKWLALPAMAAVGVTSMAANASFADDYACFIAATQQGGMIALEAQFTADTHLNGSYDLVVKGKGGGSTNIRQAGAFSAGKGETVTLGQMTLGGNAIYDVSLDVDTHQKNYSCARSVGGSV